MPKTRTMAKLDTDDFIKVFTMALKEEAVIEKLQEAVCQPLKREIATMKQIIEAKDKEIKELEEKIDNLEQYSRRNSLRLHGIAEKESENLIDEIPALLNKELQFPAPMKRADICRIHRLGPRSSQGQPRPIIVKMVSYQARSKVFSARSKLKNSSSRLFINEDLTRTRSQLFYKARQLKREKKITDTWTHDGNVLIKRGGRIIHIRNSTQLENLD